MSTISENNHLLFHLKSLDIAITQLSLRGYVIVKFVAQNKDVLPQLEINRALEEFDVIEISDKQIGYCDQWEVRIYWKLKVDSKI